LGEYGGFQGSASAEWQGLSSPLLRRLGGDA